jgi:hypothetical protein
LLALLILKIFSLSSYEGTSIVPAILNALQNLYFGYHGLRLLFGDAGSPLPKIIWNGELSVDVFDSSAIEVSPATGTIIDNLVTIQPLFFRGKATATSDTGKTYVNNVWAFGSGLQISLQNPGNEAFERILDFTVVTDRIYGDGPGSLRGLFALGEGTVPTSLITSSSLGAIRFGNASGVVNRAGVNTATSVFGLGVYVGYSTFGR